MWLGVDAVTTVLVLGGGRSGKSSYAERLLDGCAHVTYLAPGAVPDPGDTEWLARILDTLWRAELAEAMR